MFWSVWCWFVQLCSNLRALYIYLLVWLENLVKFLLRDAIFAVLFLLLKTEDENIGPCLFTVFKKKILCKICLSLSTFESDCLLSALLFSNSLTPMRHEHLKIEENEKTTPRCFLFSCFRNNFQNLIKKVKKRIKLALGLGNWWSWRKCWCLCFSHNAWHRIRLFKSSRKFDLYTYIQSL